MSNNVDMSTVIDFLIPELQAEIATQQHNATGAASALLMTERVTDGYIIKGIGYLYWVNFGRKPGKWPPYNPTTKTFDEIKRWVEVKGIASGKEVKGVTFLIARSIKEKGTPGQPYVKWTSGNSLQRKDFITKTILRNNDAIVKAIGSDFEGVIFEKFNKEAQAANAL